MKYNTVLTPQYPDSQLEERAFSKSNQQSNQISKSSSTIKEGLSSDEDDFEQKQNAEFDKFASRSQDILEEIYGLRMASYGQMAGKEKTEPFHKRASSLLDHAVAGSSHMSSNNNRTNSSVYNNSPGQSQLDKSNAIFLGTSECLPPMDNREFNRTAL